MIFFIIIIFIAEIIIATSIITTLVKFDRKIRHLNNRIWQNKYKIKRALKDLKNMMNDFLQLLKHYGECIIEKEKKYLYNLLKNIIFGTLLMLLAKKYKKQVLLFELFLIGYETYKNTLSYSLVKSKKTC